MSTIACLIHSHLACRRTMRAYAKHPRPTRRACCVALFTAVLATICNPAGAEEVVLGENPVSVIARWRPSMDAPVMPEFVQRTRPPEDSLDYTPLSGPTYVRPATKTSQELADSMIKLDSAMRANQARAGRDFRLQSPPPSQAANAAAIKRAQQFREQSADQ